MKKQWSVVLWAVVAIFVIAAAYIVYHRFNENIQLKQVPPQTEQTGSDNAGNNDTGTAGTDTAGTAEKQVVPDFTLTDINGKEVKLSDYKGKVVVLNFWAVWCKYCRQEMPELVKVSKKFDESGDAVLLAINVQEDDNTVKKYLNENNISLKVLMDYKGTVSSMFPIEGFPTTFIINRDGTPFTYIPGATNEKTLLDIVAKAK